MTPYDRERYHRARNLGRVVRVKNTLCFECVRVALLRLPENKHNGFDHRHMVLMPPGAASSALAARAQRTLVTTAKALKDLITPDDSAKG
jgi:hypothetical protein